MTAVIVESVSDLDLLDDDLEHGICMFCYPDTKVLDKFISFCGREILHNGRILDYLPPNACPDCVKVWMNNRKLCPKCGK